MEITKFPIQGNFHISMAGYFQHGNYPISKMCMWKLSHFHGPLFPTWKLSNFQGVEIFIFPCLLRRCLRFLLATDWYSPQTGNDKIFIIFITWKLPNFQFREIFIFPWLGISNMEIIQFPRCAYGNCYISMALYFKHGNYQISKAWKFSYIHGVDPASAATASASWRPIGIVPCRNRGLKRF